MYKKIFRRAAFALLIISNSITYRTINAQNLDTISLFKQVNQSVVIVFGLNANDEIVKQGSGFVVQNGDIIVTNYHNIAGVQSVEIKSSKGNIYPTDSLIGLDEKLDIAIFKISNSKELKPLKLGDSDFIQIGEEVVAIGSPAGLENTISKGIISGKRQFHNGISYLQTTASISSGSSGGPLFNAEAEVIGITTFLMKGAQNLNFCIPINSIHTLLDYPQEVKFDVFRKKGFIEEEDLLGLWHYETTCPVCICQNAFGTIYIELQRNDLIIKGHITYTDGTEFSWIELAYTDGNNIWAYAVNDHGDVGIHTYRIESKERLESNWAMSNGTYGISSSVKY